MSTFTWKCPKCGYENVVSTERAAFSIPVSMCCDSNYGGCDEMFAVQARPVTTWEVKVYELVEVK